jgi:hypothetical protein
MERNPDQVEDFEQRTLACVARQAFYLATKPDPIFVVAHFPGSRPTHCPYAGRTVW